MRHNTLMQKLAQFPLPDFAYNWVADFLLGRKHLTKFEQALSSVLAINASIIQGSVIGPTAYVINASDLVALVASNSLDKYADDTYLIVPASNSHAIPAELNNISAWAIANNQGRSHGGMGGVSPQKYQKNHELAKSSRINNTDTVTLGFSNLVTFLQLGKT